MTAPVVSVVIPSFNCARYLPEAVASARGQHPSMEFIIVDDGSTDDTAAVVARLDVPLTFVQQPNGGISAARNSGIVRARGEYLAFLDADDLYAPGGTARQIARLEAPDGPDLSFGVVEEFISPELPPEQQARFQCRPRIRGRVPGAMLVRRATFERVGLFSPQWRAGEFADWLLRAGEAGLRAGDIDAMVLRRRLHGNNTSIVQRDARVDFARVLKGALDRRRATRGPEPA